MPSEYLGEQLVASQKEAVRKSKAKNVLTAPFVISGRIVSRMLKERLMAPHGDDGAANLLTGDQECAVQHQDNSLPFN